MEIFKLSLTRHSHWVGFSNNLSIEKDKTTIEEKKIVM